MKKLKGRIISIVLVLVLCVALMPPRVSAFEMDSVYNVDIHRNTTVVGFAGYQWYVIGFNGDGVYSQSGESALTLLLKDSLPSPNDSLAFRNGASTQDDPSWVQYNGGWFYEPAFTRPSDYNDSTLQKRMEAFAGGLSVKKQELIKSRTLRASDGISGDDVPGQEMWPISLQEWNTIGDKTVRGYSKDYWLRTDEGAEDARYGNNAGTGLRFDNVTTNTPALRPAFKLDLTYALFASSAVGGKSGATVGGNLAATSAVTGAMKFTIYHSSQTLTVTTNDEQMNQTGATLTFPYTNATTGTNQYVSCLLVNPSIGVEYYGKLADCSSNSSGNINIPLAGVADGAYGLVIFSEEANGNNFTDFCSNPTFMYLIVQNGIGRLLDEDTCFYDGSAVRTSASTADISFNSFQLGEYYWQLDGTPPANAAELVSGGNLGGAMSYGLNTRSFSGLSEGEHILYIVGMDYYGTVYNILTINIPAYVPPPPPTTKVPRTGDNGIIPGWLMLSASVSGLLLLTAWRKYRKSKNER
ncbi:MAG: hypothetical protein GX222_07880 [Ruminococcaceae bacterium]|nr:hypothetical protein [Oscillospiraceae bacterium]